MDLTVPYAPLEVAAWQRAREWLAAPHGTVNLGAAIDRHAALRPDQVAIKARLGDGSVTMISYRQLCAETTRIAHALRAAGLRHGDSVFILLDRSVHFPKMVIGALKAGGVAAPLFSAFGPEPIRSRIAVGGEGLLITSRLLYERKIAPMRAQLPQLRGVVLIDGAADGPAQDCHDLTALVADTGDGPCVIETDEDATALLHFTSGTSGTPKAVLHPHRIAVSLVATAREVLDLGGLDRFWCTADPGWVTGTAYGVLAPLLIGATLVIDTAPFDATRWLDTLATLRVSVWYTTPTALRLIMRNRPMGKPALDLPGLRVVASVGEPLNAEVVEWGRVMLGQRIRDTWWQTETGAIMIANTPASASAAGAMGRPVIGVRAHLVRRLPLGLIQVLDDHAAAEGELAFETGWPAMFSAYLRQPTRYRANFSNGLYLTGDLARRDARGDYWFVGRADDAIKASGHLIGAFEVERALLSHPAVAEAAAIGMPDPTCGERVEAVVTLNRGFTPDEALAEELRGRARIRLGAALAPKVVSFAETLPHTRSGKIMRRLVKAREMGDVSGDWSMLEEAFGNDALKHS